MAAPTRARVVLLTSQSVTAGSTVRGRLDMGSADGGIVTVRITNGATGPTVQAVGRIMVAHHANGSMPAAAAEGTADTDWKQVDEFSPGVGNNATARRSFSFGPEVASVQVEITGHTGQAVTAEAIATTYTY